MKAIICVMLLSTLLGCQQVSEQLDEGEVTDLIKAENRLNSARVVPYMNMLAGSKILSGKLTENEQQELMVEGEIRKKQLSELSTLPELVEGEPLSLPLKEAEGRYAKFITDHKEKSVLPLFRQKYARAIIIDYKLLESNDYDKIRYYINELLESESFDYRTISLGLMKLNGYADANYIKASINHLLPIMQHRQELETIALNSLIKMKGEPRGEVRGGIQSNAPIKNPTADVKKMLLGTDSLRKKLENSDTKECIAILKELNGKISNS